MAVRERGIEIKQSRVSFFYNYLLIVMVLVLFALVWKQFNLTFTFFPKDFSEFSKTLISFSFLGLVAFLLEEPEVRRLFCKYIITNNEVIKVEGILRKRRKIIPYQSVANVSVYKGITGRILNFGDINVLGFKDQIDMRGIKDPEVFYRIINNKISVMRGTKHTVMPKERVSDEGKVIVTDWREEQKRLEKEVHTPTAMGGKKLNFFRILKGGGETEEFPQEEFEGSTEGGPSESGITPSEEADMPPKEADVLKVATMLKEADIAGDTEERSVKKTKRRRTPRKKKKKGKRK